jgi:hypothetical protein
MTVTLDSSSSCRTRNPWPWPDDPSQARWARVAAFHSNLGRLRARRCLKGRASESVRSRRAQSEPGKCSIGFKCRRPPLEGRRVQGTSRIHLRVRLASKNSTSGSTGVAFQGTPDPIRSARPNPSLSCEEPKLIDQRPALIDSAYRPASLARVCPRPPGQPPWLQVVRVY